jgi:hypothetical protein
VENWDCAFVDVICGMADGGFTFGFVPLGDALHELERYWRATRRCRIREPDRSPGRHLSVRGMQGPKYFERRGTPKEPAALLAHNCLGCSHFAWGDEWRFTGPGRSQSVALTGNLQSNSANALRLAAVHEQGLDEPDVFRRRGYQGRPAGLALAGISPGRARINPIYPHRQPAGEGAQLRRSADPALPRHTRPGRSRAASKNHLCPLSWPLQCRHRRRSSNLARFCPAIAAGLSAIVVSPAGSSCRGESRQTSRGYRRSAVGSV